MQVANRFVSREYQRLLELGSRTALVAPALLEKAADCHIVVRLVLKSRVAVISWPIKVTSQGGIVQAVIVRAVIVRTLIARAVIVSFQC